MKTNRLLSKRWLLHIIPWLILAIGLGLTWVLVLRMQGDELAHNRAEFEIRSSEVVAGIEQQESALKHRIQAALGSATAALFQQGKVTWRKAKDRLAPDIDRLSQEHPELLQQYAKAIPGTRRFTIQTTATQSH